LRIAGFANSTALSTISVVKILIAFLLKIKVLVYSSTPQKYPKPEDLVY
jgi:hypothetical protein